MMVMLVIMVSLQPPLLFVMLMMMVSLQPPLLVLQSHRCRYLHVVAAVAAAVNV